MLIEREVSHPAGEKARCFLSATGASRVRAPPAARGRLLERLAQRLFRLGVERRLEHIAPVLPEGRQNRVRV